MEAWSRASLGEVAGAVVTLAGEVLLVTSTAKSFNFDIWRAIMLSDARKIPPVTAAPIIPTFFASWIFQLRI
jgi:hypothetical protein